jgi:hypothetical protein
MALKKIDERLSRLQGLVGNWNATGSVPRIERDIVLEELRRLYDEVLDYACDAEQSAVNMEDEKPAVEVAVAANGVSKDMGDDAASEEVGVVFDDVLDIAALLGLSGDDSIEIAERTVEEKHTQEVETTESVETVSAPAAEEIVEEVEAPVENSEDVVVEEPAEMVVEPDVVEAVVEESKESEQTVEPIVEQTTEVAPKEVVEEPKPMERATDGGLFDIDDIPVQTRTGRRMISLYNEPVQRESVVETVDKPAVESETNIVVPVPTPIPNPTPAPAPKPVVRVEDTVKEADVAPQRLGDVIAKNVTTLADKMAEEKPTAAFNRIPEIRKAIGLNDKFLMIRDLFGGDVNLYEDTITHLDQFTNLDECMIFIVENFRWNPDSEGAKLLVSLIERKLS